jgi:hypothetical protein
MLPAKLDASKGIEAVENKPRRASIGKSRDIEPFEALIIGTARLTVLL